MMQLISEENIKISNSTFSVEDALKNNTNVSIKIEAAHAGVMNGNYLFYLPKALASGANSLNKFYKPLQKKHYSKTLGYIYESKYIETDISSSYYNDIINSKNKKDESFFMFINFKVSVTNIIKKTNLLIGFLFLE